MTNNINDKYLFWTFTHIFLHECGLFFNEDLAYRNVSISSTVDLQNNYLMYINNYMNYNITHSLKVHFMLCALLV